VLDDRASFTDARWVTSTVGEDHVAALQAATGLSPIAARVLARRWDGDHLPASWLEPSIEHLHDPHGMLNMDAALDRLRSALRRKERIRIVTDYDVDGTTSSLLLQAVLRIVEPSVEIDFHIPSRFDEGYGFSARAAAAAAEAGVGLVVTADIGVRDHEAVHVARQAGVDVLVCDHHLPAGASVPADAIVLCPPQRGCGYKNRALAACGVSLKLAQALLATANVPNADRILRSLLKLAAIGTVADMVSLGTLENRAIVALGLAELSRGPHSPGLKALLTAAGLTGRRIDARDLGYRIGPRINAAGRVAEAKRVVDLLLCRDPEQAEVLARQLEGLNTDRRDIQKRLVEESLARMQSEDKEDSPFVVLAGPEDEGWHRGVVGIVASRLKDELHRPVAVVSIQGERAVGSVRSVPGKHAVEALEAASDLLLKFGGHPAAAGFTVRTADLPALRERLAAWAAGQPGGSSHVRVHEADAVVEATDITDRLSNELGRLEPFGMGNPCPKFVVPGVRPLAVQRRGADNAMLKFLVPRRHGAAIEAIWWNHGHRAEAFVGGEVDLLARLGTHTWKGETSLQLELEDARPAAA
jgi:single-stranded-DNA-specific exonuclease